MAIIAQKSSIMVCCREHLDDAKILAEIFVCAIKDDGTDPETWKAGFGVQEHRDKLQNQLVSSGSVVTQHTRKSWIELMQYLAFQYFQLMSLNCT